MTALFLVATLIALGKIAQAESGWKTVKRNEFIDYDLERFPLQIKTDSPLGSEDILRVYFYDSKSTFAGAFGIKFDSRPQYYLRGCRTYTDFPTTLPQSVHKIWSLAVVRSSDSVDQQVCDKTSALRLVVLCNGVEVLNFVFSPATCPDDDWIRPYLRGRVSKLWFYSGDTASDSFLSQSEGPCLCSDLNSADWTVSDVKYDMAAAHVLPTTPLIVGRKVIRNQGSKTHTMKLAVSETVSETMLFGEPTGYSISDSAVFRVSVPFIAAGKVSERISPAYNFSFGKEILVEKALTLELECNGPAGKVTTCTVVVVKEQANIPFTMKWTKNSDNACSCQVQGVYRGVAADRLEAIIEERAYS